VTAVKDQGMCGSCWAFSATGSLEGSYFLKHGQLLSFSEQQLVDCSKKQGNEGCNGGLMDTAFSYVKENGLCLETDYPYNAKDGQCESTCLKTLSGSGFVDIPENDEAALERAVLTIGPISVAIQADKPAFQFYKTGVFDDPSCGTNLDHGVLVVGLGTLKGKDYWIVKNSWGQLWGSEGYILLARGKNMCGIAQQASYPLVE
jgi:cathepsin L